MVLRMARPTTRVGSSIVQFRQRVPADLRGKTEALILVVPVGDGEATVRLSVRSETIQFSLGTRDPAEARARHKIAASHVEGVWAALRSGPEPLSFKQIRALVRDRYVELVDAFDAEPGNAADWETFAKAILAPDVADSSRQPVGSGLRISLPGEPRPRRWSQLVAADRLLAKRRIVTDYDSRVRLGAEIDKALADGAHRLQQVAEGDYSPDRALERFPALEIPSAPTLPRKEGGASFDDLLTGWWREAEAAGLALRTFVNYRSAFRALKAFLGHDDAPQVEREDIIRFKDHRLSEVSARTVKDNDLAALKSVFGWALSNGRIAANPATGVTVRRVRSKRLRSPGYSEGEAVAILAAALNLRAGQESLKMFMAKRWAPWLMAYTGARVGEVAQLRKQDLISKGDHWAIVVTPEAGTVKGGQFREVPLHPHLVELGFVSFVQASNAGHLFVEPNAETGEVLGPLKGVTNRLAKFAREHVSDKRILPNHAWRHRFETLGREHGMREDLQNKITGHSGSTVAAREYGDAAGLYGQICKLPHVVLPPR